MVHPHLQERARLRVERRLPELFRVHLAEALVALQGEAAPALLQHALQQAAGAVDAVLALADAQHRRLVVDRLQFARAPVEADGVDMVQQAPPDPPGAHGPLVLVVEGEAEILFRPSGPAARGGLLQRIEPGRDAPGRGLHVFPPRERRLVERPRQHRLLDEAPVADKLDERLDAPAHPDREPDLGA